MDGSRSLVSIYLYLHNFIFPLYKGGMLPHANERLYICKYFCSLATSVEQFSSLSLFLFLPSFLPTSSTILEIPNHTLTS